MTVLSHPSRLLHATMGKRIATPRAFVGLDMTDRSVTVVTIDDRSGQPRLTSYQQISHGDQAVAANFETTIMNVADRLPRTSEDVRWSTSASIPTSWIRCQTVPLDNAASSGTDSHSDRRPADMFGVRWQGDESSQSCNEVLAPRGALVRLATALEECGYLVERLLPRSVSVLHASQSLLDIDAAAVVMIERDGIEVSIKQNQDVGLTRNYVPTDGMGDASRDKAFQNRVAIEINQALQYAAREDRELYNKERPVLIAGQGAGETRWDRALARHLGRPVATWQLQTEVRGCEQTLPPSAAVAVSAAWSGYQCASARHRVGSGED